MAFGLPSAFLDTLFLVGFVHFKETAERHIQFCALFEHGFMFPRLRFSFGCKSPLLCLFPLPFPVGKAVDYPPRSRGIVFVYSHLTQLPSIRCNILFYEKM